MIAVVAWDCADEAYRERAYNGMAAEIERLKERLARAEHISKQRKNKKDVAATARNRATDGLEYWKARAEAAEKALREIGEMGPHTAAWSAQTVARVALAAALSTTRRAP